METPVSSRKHGPLTWTLSSGITMPLMVCVLDAHVAASYLCDGLCKLLSLNMWDSNYDCKFRCDKTKSDAVLDKKYWDPED